MLLLLFFFMFSILFVNNFKGSFYHCSAAVTKAQLSLLQHPRKYESLSPEELKWCGTHAADGLCSNEASLAYADAGSTTDPSGLNSRVICHWMGGTWERVIPQSFDNVFWGMLALFEVSTTEGWTSMMFATVDSVAPEMQPIKGHRENVMVLYFVVILLGSFFMMNLFVGVVIDNFKRLKAEIGEGESILLTPEQKQWVRVQRIIQRIKPEHKVPEPENEILKLFYLLTYGASPKPVSSWSPDDLVRQIDECASQHNANQHHCKFVVYIRRHQIDGATLLTNMKGETEGMNFISKLVKQVQDLYSWPLGEDYLKRIGFVANAEEGNKSHATWSQYRRFILAMVRWHYYCNISPKEIFEGLIMLFIALNTAVMAMRHFGQSSERANFIEYTNMTFALIFTMEFIIKFFAAPRFFFKSNWNTFDFCVVVLTDLSLVVTLSTHRDVVTAFIPLVRILRVARIVRLLRQFPSLRALVQAIILALPSLFNVTALLMLMFFIFSVLGVQLFAKVQRVEHIDAHTNFASCLDAILTLFRCATGEAWNSLMYELASRQPGCHPDLQWAANICGFEGSDEYDCVPINGCGTEFSYPFFIVFELLVSFVFLNLFIGVILEGFEEANSVEKGNQQETEVKKADGEDRSNRTVAANQLSEAQPETTESSEITEREYERFCGMWVEFDQDLDWLLPEEDLARFIKKLGQERHPMGWHEDKYAPPGRPTLQEFRQRFKEIGLHPMLTLSDEDETSSYYFWDVAKTLAKRMVIQRLKVDVQDHSTLTRIFDGSESVEDSRNINAYWDRKRQYHVHRAIQKIRRTNVSHAEKLYDRPAGRTHIWAQRGDEGPVAHPFGAPYLPSMLGVLQSRQPITHTQSRGLPYQGPHQKHFNNPQQSQSYEVCPHHHLPPGQSKADYEKTHHFQGNDNTSPGQCEHRSKWKEAPALIRTNEPWSTCSGELVMSVTNTRGNSPIITKKELSKLRARKELISQQAALNSNAKKVQSLTIKKANTRSMVL